ncbi:hypothetical protein G3413_13805 [Enterococcus faecium]|nr:hypothetical protein [Enterococcus faecium]
MPNGVLGLGKPSRLAALYGLQLAHESQCCQMHNLPSAARQVTVACREEVGITTILADRDKGGVWDKASGLHDAAPWQAIAPVPLRRQR